MPRKPRKLTAVVDDEARPGSRYGLYVFDACPECGGRGVTGEPPVRACGTCKGKGAALHRIAETSLDGIGLALATLAEDRDRLDDPGNPVIGVLDQVERRWLSGVWQRGRP